MIWLSLAHKAYAYDLNEFSTIGSGPGGKDYAGFLTDILTYMVGIASALAVLALVVGAVLYLAAAGDPAKADKAKKTITWAVVGIVSLALFYVILRAVIPAVLGTADII